MAAGESFNLASSGVEALLCAGEQGVVPSLLERVLVVKVVGSSARQKRHLPALRKPLQPPRLQQWQKHRVVGDGQAHPSFARLA